VIQLLGNNEIVQKDPSRAVTGTSSESVFRCQTLGETLGKCVGGLAKDTRFIAAARPSGHCPKVRTFPAIAGVRTDWHSTANWSVNVLAIVISCSTPSGAFEIPSGDVEL
jgi:hypothetical protein